MHEQDVMRNVETFANEVRLIQRLEEHNGAVNSVAFYGNNLLASASGSVGGNAAGTGGLDRRLNACSRSFAGTN